jgi:NADH:quinone reductase (non-electrogenic)
MIHENVKQALVDNDERSTNLIFRALKNTARVAKNSVSDEVVRRLALPGATFADVQGLVSGAKGAVVLETGDVEAGIYWTSMAQGLIHDIPTCKEVIDRIITDADAIVNKRLLAFSNNP